MNNQKLINFLKIIFHLVHYHLLIFRKKITNECINFAIWGSISTFVTGTLLGNALSTEFATFQFCGVISNVGLWVSFHEIVEFITDIENKKRLFYDLSVPLPSIYFFLAKIIFYIIRFSILTSIMMIVLKLILYNVISFQALSISKFIIISLITNLFYGSWIIFISSVIKKSRNLSNLFCRIQFPLWFMGGFQFSWITLYNANKILGIVDLLNPILYINEGFKDAILGIRGITSFHFLVIIIFFFSLLLFFVGFKRLQKQLDFI
jgi:ABC-type polysaccharide/polyol phosphate export permease